MEQSQELINALIAAFSLTKDIRWRAVFYSRQSTPYLWLWEVFNRANEFHYTVLLSEERSTFSLQHLIILDATSRSLSEGQG